MTNHIVLHEIATVSSNTSVPVGSATALCPQMILMQYPEGQNSEKIIAENYEKFNAASSDEDIITDYDGQEEVSLQSVEPYLYFPAKYHRAFLS